MLIYVNNQLHYIIILYISQERVVMIMALWLAVSIKCGECNIVLPITVECEPDETFMDLLEKVMAQSTSESPPFDVEYVSTFFFAHFLTVVFRIR